MTTSDDEKRPTREELMRAREEIQGQLETVSNPALGRDRNRPLEAKLRAMLKDIDACPADTEPDNA